MCGRFALSPKTNSVEKLFPESGINLENNNSYNICPTMDIVGITFNGDYKHNLYRWGWTLNSKLNKQLILFNARAENLLNKRIYTDAISQRVVIPASAYYEWSKSSSGKLPYCIRLQNEELFGFAGLYREEMLNNHLVRSVTIITCEANAKISKIHNRMPIVLDSTTVNKYLNNSESIKQFAYPYSPDKMVVYPVSQLVNSPKFNSPECLINKSDSLLELF